MLHGEVCVQVVDGYPSPSPGPNKMTEGIVKRTVLKRFPLGRFKISPNGIESLRLNIEGLGKERQLQLSSIYVNTTDSESQYSSVEELRNDRAWEQRIVKFNLSFYELQEDGRIGPRGISIGGGTWMDNSIYASSDDEAWAVGTGRVVREVMRRYEVWYKYFVIDWMVRAVYPVVLAVFAAYNIWHQWIEPNLSESSKASLIEHGGQSLGSFTILVIMLLLTWLSYKIPIGSRIVEDRSEEQKSSRHRTILLTLTAIGVLFAALGVLFEWIRN